MHSVVVVAAIRVHRCGACVGGVDSGSDGVSG